MQDTITCSSPYRKRGRQEKKEFYIPKIFKKFVIKLILASGILSGILWLNKNETITSSYIWQQIINILGYDIDYNQAKTTLSQAVAFIRESFPEYFGEEESEEKISEDEQMQLDVKEILDKTKVLRPVSGVATQRFEKKEGEIIHRGVDLAAEIGTPIKAAISGEVIKVENLENSFGTYVKIQNENIVTTYAHCSTIEVKEGDLVNQGEIIAYSGNTGKSTGPHLHFEISINERYVDPGFLLTYNVD